MKYLNILTILYYIFHLIALIECQKNIIQDGITACNYIIEYIKEIDFMKSIEKMSDLPESIFTINDVTVKLMKLDLNETKELREKLEEMNLLIEKKNLELNQMYSVLDWNNIGINLMKLEDTIINLWNLSRQIVLLNENDQRQQISLFLTQYKKQYNQSGSLLYNYLTNLEQNQTQNIYKAAQIASKYNRKQMQKFMISNTILIIQSIQLEIAYKELKNENDYYIKFGWIESINILSNKLLIIDSDTKNYYSIQYKDDIKDILKLHYNLTNQQFTDYLYKYLINKYYWREWFVLISDPLISTRDYSINTCHGIIYINQDGRNLVVSSIDILTESEDILKHIEYNRKLIDTFDIGYDWMKTLEYSRYFVEDMRKKLRKCSQADTIASVSIDYNVWIVKTRFIVYKLNCVFGREPCYYTFIFG